MIQRTFNVDEETDTQTITISQGNKGFTGTMDKADQRNSPEGEVGQRLVRRASQRKRYLS